MSVETIGLWTNKGGVGKTTLTFHLSTAYAYLHPDKRVVVVDMCPQANLSNTMLTSTEEDGTREPGSTTVEILKEADEILQASRTVAGYLHTMLNPDPGVFRKSSEFLTQVVTHNKGMSDNIWLFCGDDRLDDMNARLAQAINGNRDGFRDPFVSNLKLLRRFFINLQQEPGWADADIMVFIDTNPAFTEYTQMALCSMDKLVIPVNADEFSLQAVDYMFRRLWNMFPKDDELMRDYVRESFGVRVYNRMHESDKSYQRTRDLLPKIAAVVHNRHNVHKTRAVCAFSHLHSLQGERIYEAHKVAHRLRGEDPRMAAVFVDKGLPTATQFNDIYTATMREMFSIGVASAHTGIPLHGVRTKRKSIQKAFDTTSIGKDEQLVAVTSDLLKVLAIVLDNPSLSSANDSRLFEMMKAGAVPISTRGEVERLLSTRTVSMAYNDAARMAAEWEARDALMNSGPGAPPNTAPGHSGGRGGSGPGAHAGHHGAVRGDGHRRPREDSGVGDAAGPSNSGPRAL